MNRLTSFPGTTSALLLAFLLFVLPSNYSAVLAQTNTNTTEDNVEYVDFLVTADRVNLNNTAEHYVARISNPAVIAVARAELEKDDNFQIVAGTIVREPVDWNPGFSYHMDPDTVEFGENYIEVCDANPVYVEENLDDPAFGESFLPNNFWCPWGSRVLEELAVGTDAPTMSPEPTEPPRSGAAPAVMAFWVSLFGTCIAGGAVAVIFM